MAGFGLWRRARGRGIARYFVPVLARVPLVGRDPGRTDACTVAGLA